MPADFNAVRYEVAIVQKVKDKYPNWVEEFKRSPAKIVKFARKKYYGLRHFQNMNDFHIHTILSNAAEKIDPGNYKTNVVYKIIFVQKINISFRYLVNQPRAVLRRFCSTSVICNRRHSCGCL